MAKSKARIFRTVRKFARLTLAEWQGIMAKLAKNYDKAHSAMARAILLSTTAALVAAGACPNPTIAGTDTGLTGAEGTVRAFYALMTDGRCDAAAHFRTGYTAERCGTISDVEIRHLKQEYGDETTAVVDLDLLYRRAGKPETFQGFLTLRYKREGWVIDDNSYRGRSTIDLSRYLATVARVEPSATVDGTTKADRPTAPRPDTGIAALPIAPAPVKPNVPALAPPMATPASAQRTFGSDVVLTSLWSTEELEGSPGDRRITRLKPPDRQPPARLLPQTALPPLADGRRRSIRRVEPYDGQKIVALTFDLCERADDVTGYDRDVVNVLRAHGAAATFFAGGKWMRSHPDKAIRLDDRSAVRTRQSRLDTRQLPAAERRQGRRTDRLDAGLVRAAA